MDRIEIERFVTRWLNAVTSGNSSEFEHLVARAVFDENSAQKTSVAAFRERALAVKSAFSKLEGQIDALLVDGERIAWRWTLCGTHSGAFLGEPPTSKVVRLSGTNFQRLAGGLVIAHYTLVDVAGALRQIRGA
jgi:steroid delta-isomerase-like uncharacterized protein